MLDFVSLFKKLIHIVSLLGNYYDKPTKILRFGRVFHIWLWHRVIVPFFIMVLPARTMFFYECMIANANLPPYAAPSTPVTVHVKSSWFDSLVHVFRTEFYCWTIYHSSGLNPSRPGFSWIHSAAINATNVTLTFILHSQKLNIGFD